MGATLVCNGGNNGGGGRRMEERAGTRHGGDGSAGAETVEQVEAETAKGLEGGST